MTIEQIIQLTKAGFSADQITALAPLISGEQKTEPKPEPKPEPEQKPNPKPEQKPNQKPEPKTNPEQKPEPKTNPEPAPATLDGVMKQIAALTQAITANAIINTKQPGISTESAEDALASIVIPTSKEEFRNGKYSQRRSGIRNSAERYHPGNRPGGSRRTRH